MNTMAILTKTLPEAFPFNPKTPILDNLNRLLLVLEARLQAVEAVGAKLDIAIDDLTAVALTRMNETFTPLINEAETRLAKAGASFNATSVTPLTVSTGDKYLTLDVETREAFAVSDYVSISHTGGTEYMIAHVLDYTRNIGQLHVNVVTLAGSGTHSSWDLRFAAVPNASHETNLNNPHATTAAQVGAYTKAEDDALLNTRLLKVNNLLDLTNPSVARANLGLKEYGTSGNRAALLDGANLWTKPQTATAGDISDNVAANFGLRQIWTATVSGGSFVIANPSGAPIDNTVILLLIKFDSGRCLALR